MIDYLCSKCSDHFNGVKKFLNELGVNYIIDGKIVRGLDYYTNTAFELTSKYLGSQDALAGGGRYDLLIEELGGKSTPGVGWAAGFERLMLVMEKLKKDTKEEPENLVYLAAVDEESRNTAIKFARLLRNKDIKTDLDFNLRSLKSQFRDANKKLAELVIVINKEEYTEKKITVKNMKTGEQKVLNSDILIDEIKNTISNLNCS
jgi:histidyl-tRNA synthetase